MGVLKCVNTFEWVIIDFYHPKIFFKTRINFWLKRVEQEDEDENLHNPKKQLMLLTLEGFTHN